MNIFNLIIRHTALHIFIYHCAASLVFSVSFRLALSSFLLLALFMDSLSLFLKNPVSTGLCWFLVHAWAQSVVRVWKIGYLVPQLGAGNRPLVRCHEEIKIFKMY